MTDPLVQLGEKVKLARIQQRYSLKSAAAAAEMSRDTWKKIEDGKSVQDTRRQAALELLGLDWWGEPVGGRGEDASYVAAPGERVEPRESNEAVLRAIGEMREHVDEQFAALSQRVAKLEQSGS